MIQQRPFDCPATAVRVTVYRQTFMVSGVGSSTTIKQHDHDCSRADTCPHRYTDACLVRRLNR
ncbi:hypothetical protein BM43_7637 (plasmid) [Burkholderia gladioli]|nr:hypothetical protein BM43_7637 [Burkholderia gladioli]